MPKLCEPIQNGSIEQTEILHESMPRRLCRKQNRTPEGMEKRRARDRERSRLRQKDPEFKKRANERKRKIRESKKYELNEYSRNYYNKNRHKLTEQIYRGRARRNPLYGLNGAINKLRNGNMSLDEFTKIYGERIAQINDRIERQSTNQ